MPRCVNTAFSERARVPPSIQYIGRNRNLGHPCCSYTARRYLGGLGCGKWARDSALCTPERFTCPTYLPSTFTSSKISGADVDIVVLGICRLQSKSLVIGEYALE